MVDRQAFSIALRDLGSGDGSLFESLASAFAVIEYGRLRTVASSSGDGGRDAYLALPEEEESVALQYSVTKYAADKIRRTAKRLADTNPKTRSLIYVTSQEIGTRADELRRELRRSYGLILDIWDANWFLDRMYTHPQREQAAAELVRIKLGRSLADEDVISSRAVSLTSEEERSAATYLAMQYEDETREKGLTKLCYGSLVRAALRDTDSSSRISRQEVHDRVAKMVPTHDKVKIYVDSALARLSKSVIRHWRRKDEFCLSHEEKARVRQRLVTLQDQFERYDEEISKEVAIMAGLTSVNLDDDELSFAIQGAKGLIDRVLLYQGEQFASALAKADVTAISGAWQIDSLLARAIEDVEGLTKRITGVATAVARSLLSSPPPNTVSYLRQWADSYTLFSLLRETPDVQQLVVKMFSGGRIWIDSNLLLPILAEELAFEEDRHITRLLRAARDCGLTLHATNGIVEELAMHMRRCLAYVRTISQGRVWDGKVPLLYLAHAASGAPMGAFPAWIENFRGEIEPLQDVAEYLEDEYNIRIRDIPESDRSSVEIRGALQEIWYEAKEKGSARSWPPDVIRKLVKHDVECYLGVVELRREERRSSLGFNTWWLTMDLTAYRVHQQLAGRIIGSAPAPPVMSPDFLVNYLEIGPLRARVSKRKETMLPVMVDISFLEGISEEVLEVAQRIRSENEGKSQRVIQRMIRDELNAKKAVQGQIATGGSQLVEEELLSAIQAGNDDTDSPNI